MILIAEKIIEKCRQKGMVQGDVAKQMGVSRQVFSNWMTGCRNPKTVNVKKIADILGTTIWEIAQDESEKLDNPRRENKASQIMEAINKEFLNDASLPDEAYRKIVRIVNKVMQEDSPDAK